MVEWSKIDIDAPWHRQIFRHERGLFCCFSSFCFVKIVGFHRVIVSI